MIVGQSTVQSVRVWPSWVRAGAVACLALLLAVVLAPSTALAAGSTKHPATASTSVTSPAPAPTATAPAVSPSGGGSLGGALTAPGAVPTAASTTPTVLSASTASTSGSTSLSGGSAIAIAIGAFIVVGGISYFIWRDARRRAPVAVHGDADRQNRPGSRAPPKARKLSAAERKRRKRGRAKR